MSWTKRHVGIVRTDLFNRIPIPERIIWTHKIDWNRVQEVDFRYWPDSNETTYKVHIHWSTDVVWEHGIERETHRLDGPADFWLFVSKKTLEWMINHATDPREFDEVDPAAPSRLYWFVCSRMVHQQDGCLSIPDFPKIDFSEWTRLVREDESEEFFIWIKIAKILGIYDERFELVRTMLENF